MGVIIGNLTTVSFGLSNGDCGINQASWSANPGVQRLYCVGKVLPYKTIEKPTATLSMTIYAGTSTGHLIPAATACTNASSVTASIVPQSCPAGEGYGPDAGNTWYVNSYSFAKDDAQMPGTESWSMIAYTGIGDAAPDLVLRGLSEGTSSSPEINTGVVFDTGVGTTLSTQGSISAGQFGKSNEVKAGIVTSVGGGTETQGVIGQASVSIQLTPVWY
jgi:hypothetical protein